MGRRAERQSAARLEIGELTTPERLQDLLTKTSRTFALNIPLLPEPTRCEVTVAYLLFRVADTLEDATQWSRAKKLQELDRFARVLRTSDVPAAGRLASSWAADPPIDHVGYLELLAELPLVMRITEGLAPDSRELVVKHTLRTADGMSTFLVRADETELRLRDVTELQAYCYAVAGIVGEMLTELFLKDRPQLRAAAPTLRELAPKFGEALQLVNILKDSAWDSDEGRHFLPVGADPAEVFALARTDLDQAARYVVCLDRSAAPRGFVAFTALPLLLALATIDRVEQQGPGSKITRSEVGEIIRRLDHALNQGTVATLFNRFERRGDPQ